MTLIAGYNLNWSNGPSNSSGTKKTIFTYQEVAVECSHLDAWKSNGGNSPFTSMNLLIKMAACLGVSPVRNSSFIEPGNNARKSLLWLTGRAARLEISLIATLDCILTKSESMYQGRDMDGRYDNGYIHSMFGRKKRCSPI